MKKPLILKTYEKPTIFNKEMAIGFFVVPILGAIVGGIMGKNRMSREYQDGKLVGEPSANNNDSLLGTLIGVNAGIAAGIIAGGPAAGLLILGLAVAGAIIGGLIGSKKGMRNQEEEYAIALRQKSEGEQQKSQAVYMVMENEQTTGKSYSADILAERLRSANQKKEL